MAYPKKPPNEKKYGICGCVVIHTKEIMRQEAARQGISVGNMLGVILDDWAKEKFLASPDERQEYLPFRQDQEEKKKRSERMYTKGALGVEKGK